MAIRSLESVGFDKARPITVLMVVLAFVALASTSAASDLKTIRERGELVMLCFPQQQSSFVHTMVDELGAAGLNVYGGKDVELMRRFARHLGVELEIVVARDGVADLIPALVRGDGDIVANAVGVTVPRRKLADFSAPYITSREALIVRKGSGIRGVEDLAGKTVATIAGSSHEDVIQRLGIEKLRWLFVDFTLEAYEAVRSGEADFTVLDAASAEEMLGQMFDLGRDLELVEALDEEAHYAFAIRKGSDLEPVLNAWIESIRADGTLDRILSGDFRDSAEAP